MQNTAQKATVVGAGLVGSLWGILLAKRGYQVDIFERRADFRQAGFVGGRSINLAMSTRGWRALEKAGVADEIRKEGLPMYGRLMHNTDGSKVYQPYGKEGEAIFSVSRGNLNRRLVQLADSFSSVSFHFSHRCEGRDKDTGAIHFFDENTQKPVTHESALVFGSDGAYSALRKSMQYRPRFNYSQNYLPHGYKELSIPPSPTGEFQLEPNALHIWPRGDFMLIALPNLDGSFTCTLFLAFEGTHSFANLDSDDAILAFFETHFPDALALMPHFLEEYHENPTAPLMTVKCSPWNYKNTLLLGDASHAIVPFYGQGMNAGFEDCSLLDELADTYQEDWPRIFETFGATRPKDANAIADLALRNFVEMRDKVADAQFLLRKKIAAHYHEKFGARFMPLYSLVTFSHTPYSEALHAGVQQDLLFQEILRWDNIEENWQNNPKLDDFVLRWIEAQQGNPVS